MSNLMCCKFTVGRNYNSTHDTYGTYDNNGENKLYTKRGSNNTTYRFLGWSTNPSADVPDIDLDVFNSARKYKYTIYNNTTLYAVWEPVLKVNATLGRTLGEQNFDGNISLNNTIKSMDASKPVQNIETIIKPGEQGYYKIESSGNSIKYTIIFDDRVTDIYTHGDSEAIWKDTLNPSTNEDAEKDQGHGLNRHISNNNKITRKFFMPLYIGTEHSYDTSNPLTATKPVNKYNLVFKAEQPSYYYKTVHNKNEEVYIIGTIYITDKKPADFDNKQDNDTIISVLDELKTKIKVKLR